MAIEQANVAITRSQVLRHLKCSTHRHIAQCCCNSFGEIFSGENFLLYSILYMYMYVCLVCSSWCVVVTGQCCFMMVLCPWFCCLTLPLVLIGDSWWLARLCHAVLPLWACPLPLLACLLPLLACPLPLLACLDCVMLPGTPEDFSTPLTPVTCAGMLYKQCHARSIYFWYTLGATILMLYQDCSTHTCTLFRIHVSGPCRFV